MKKLIIALLVSVLPFFWYHFIVCPSPALAQDNPNQCYNVGWKTVEYVHPVRGKTFIYLSPPSYRITATNLACTTAVQVLRHRKSMPSKMMVGIISEDYRQAFIAQWSFETDRFTIFEINIPPHEFRTQGMFMSFPEPLQRLKEVMAVRRFPQQNDLPPHLQHKFKSNYVPATVMQLRSIVEERR